MIENESYYSRNGNSEAKQCPHCKGWFTGGHYCTGQGQSVTVPSSSNALYQCAYCKKLFPANQSHICTELIPATRGEVENVKNIQNFKLDKIEKLLQEILDILKEKGYNNDDKNI